MPNMQQIISKQNKVIESKNKPQPAEPEIECRCNIRNECPLDGKCETSGIIYQATVTRQDNDSKETYIGLTDTTFKKRWSNHNNAFNDRSKRSRTKLSQHIWKLKDSNVPYDIEWKIVSKAKAYSKTSKKCNLCIREKYFIIFKPEMSTLNKRNELAAKCLHRNRHLLCKLA